MQKLFCSTFLFLSSLIQADPVDYGLVDYCERKIDEISYKLTHNMEKDRDERCYLYGKEDAFHEILFLLND